MRTSNFRILTLTFLFSSLSLSSLASAQILIASPAVSTELPAGFGDGTGPGEYVIVFSSCRFDTMLPNSTKKEEVILDMDLLVLETEGRDIDRDIETERFLNATLKKMALENKKYPALGDEGDVYCQTIIGSPITRDNALKSAKRGMSDRKRPLYTNRWPRALTVDLKLDQAAK